MPSNTYFDVKRHKRTIHNCMSFVTTLALGWRPRQRGCKVASQEEAHECKQLPLWEMEFQWTPKTSKNNFRGQNSISCGIIYIIENLLERRCLKWARISHLDIWNTSYGQKKGRESNCQFDFWLEKIGNQPDLLVCRQGATYHWKAFDESYNFASNRTSRSARKVMGLQSYGSPGWHDFGTPTRESR